MYDFLNFLYLFYLYDFLHYLIDSHYFWYLYYSFNYFFHYLFNFYKFGSHSKYFEDIVHIDYIHNLSSYHSNHTFIDF